MMKFQLRLILVVFWLQQTILAHLVTAKVMNRDRRRKIGRPSMQASVSVFTIASEILNSSNPAISGTCDDLAPKFSENHAYGTNASQKNFRRVEPPYYLRGSQRVVADTDDEAEILYVMMGEMWMLALAAKDGMGTQESPSNSYLRYFDNGDWCAVRTAFDTLLGGETKPIDGPPELSHVTLYFKDEYIHKAIPNIPRDGDCNKNPTKFAHAFTPQDIEDNYHMVAICMEHLADMNFGLDAFNCEEIPTNRAIHPDLITPGTVMMHEMMHWNFVGRTALQKKITDFQPPTGESPENGYGPYNAMQINKLGEGSAMNADNYAWFALEAFLLRDDTLGCGGTKLDPPLLSFNDPVDCSVDPFCQDQNDLGILPPSVTTG